jgi:protein O-mannosyl-transferase
MSSRGIFFSNRFLQLSLLLALVILVYLPGLNGPYVFDDQPNLKPLLDWLNGETGWQEALLGNRSGMFGRPLSMLSFVGNAKLFGMGAFSFKVTNLAIHLICGILLFELFTALLKRDARLRNNSYSVSFLLTSVWLLHPIQVSTVLYVVQRMAQLSTLFILLALLAFVRGRLSFENKRDRAGTIWLFIAVPSATILAMLCKENGALSTLLCFVVEAGYFRQSSGSLRPRAVKLFFLVGLIVPVIFISVWYTWPPSRLLSAYSVRTFTLSERLLSEPRVIWDYIGTILVPRGPSLGVYTDDFSVSHGFFSPATTAFAIVGLAALLGLACAARYKVPAFFTGVAFFIAGHAIESTVFPLELYFEHRNYLPSMGLFLALAGAAQWMLNWMSMDNESKATARRLLAFGAISLCVILSIATAARAWVWESWTTIVVQAVEQHPRSIRAQFDNLDIVWHQNDPKKTQELIDAIYAEGDPIAQHLTAAYSIILQCEQHIEITPEVKRRLEGIAGSKLQLAEMQALEQLGGYFRNHDCNGLSKIDLANEMREIVDAAPQPQANVPVWRIRFTVANLYAVGGNPNEAQIQAQKVWDTGVADPAVGILLIRIQLYNDDVAGAKATRAKLSKIISRWDQRNLTAAMDIDKDLEHR